tara:strand:- start:20 stop:346 length:327 start_codon:yes stop_codon:yes gene_type:complete
MDTKLAEINIMDTELAELNSKMDTKLAEINSMDVKLEELNSKLKAIQAQISKIEIEKAEKMKIFLFKRETLDGMTRRELQKLAKEHSLNQKAKSETIKRNLLLIFDDP